MVQQTRKQFCPHARHIAGEYQVPFGRGGPKSGDDTAERTGLRELVRDYWKAEMRIPVGRSYERHRPGGEQNFSGDILGKCLASIVEQRFVAAHSGTPPADQNETSLPHAEMIAFGITKPGQVINILKISELAEPAPLGATKKWGL